MKYGFCRVHRPVLDTPGVRTFESLAEYREWCAEDAKENGASHIELAIQRFTGRPLKFIRWLRNVIFREAPWEEAMTRPTHIYATF